MKAIELAKYTIGEYIDYFNKLAVGYELYLQAGDTASAEICLSEILGIQDKLDAVSDATDPRAWNIFRKPELTMPEEYAEYIAMIK